MSDGQRTWGASSRPARGASSVWRRARSSVPPNSRIHAHKRANSFGPSKRNSPANRVTCGRALRTPRKWSDSRSLGVRRLPGLKAQGCLRTADISRRAVRGDKIERRCVREGTYSSEIGRKVPSLPRRMTWAVTATPALHRAMRPRRASNAAGSGPFHRRWCDATGNGGSCPNGSGAGIAAGATSRPLTGQLSFELRAAKYA
jgi:hypothetical protein